MTEVRLDVLRDVPFAWVAWVDDIIFGANGATVNVWFVRGEPEAGLRPAVTSIFVARISAGWLPALPLGALFRDGWQAGHVSQTPKVTSVEHRLWTVAEPTSGGLFERDRTGPSVFGQDAAVGAYPLLARTDNTWLAGQPRSSVVALRYEQTTLIVPSSEVFRAFYASHSFVALRLLGSPFVPASLIDRERTKIDADCWTVHIQPPVPDDQALPLANLSLSPAGRASLAQLHRSVSRPGPGNFRARLPFEATTTELAVDAVRIGVNPPKYLALRVHGGRWPEGSARPSEGRPLRVSRDHPNASPDQPPPMSAPALLETDDTGGIEGVAEGGATANAVTVLVDASPLGWRDPPPQELVGRSKEEPVKGRRIIGEPDIALCAAAGDDGMADDPVARVMARIRTEDEADGMSAKSASYLVAFEGILDVAFSRSGAVGGTRRRGVARGRNGWARAVLAAKFSRSEGAGMWVEVARIDGDNFASGLVVGAFDEDAFRALCAELGRTKGAMRPALARRFGPKARVWPHVQGDGGEVGSVMRALEAYFARQLPS